MGTYKVKPIQNAEQRLKFLHHLLNDVQALEEMLDKDVFEKNVQRIGAEQEICIVTENFRPSTNALKILDQINDDHFTTEMGLFNLEINLDPLELTNNCFGQMEKQLNELLKKAHLKADQIEKNRIILTGILPTLRKKDITTENMTPRKRYKILNEAFKKLAKKNFKVVIKGVDELHIKSNNIFFETCNTSFQVHLQVPNDEIIDKYNWAQAIAGPVLSIMTNSPLLLGRELRSETRIAVFQQSLDTRNTSYHLREQKPRVSFGYDWIKDSIIDVYKDDISRYTALITSNFTEDSLDVVQKGGVPKLKALGLHNSTMYKWNRLCYGISNRKPHLRIENRYIPSGPTVKDEMANAAFWVGLMQGMPDTYKEIWNVMPFKDARGNFINASRTGIYTYFNWFGEGISAKKLVGEILIPMARYGLMKCGVSDKEIDMYLDIINERIEKNTTGSKWMVRNYRHLKEQFSNDEANVILTSAMYKREQIGDPVHLWTPISPEEGAGIAKINDTLRKVMTTEIFVVQKNDPIDLVKNIMEWKSIHHLPVVNKKNKLSGLITMSIIEKAQQENLKGELISVGQVMIKCSVKVDPETTIEDAKTIMKRHQIDCLPIIENEELIGIFTKNDLNRVIEKKKYYDKS